jgi:hypothetical protein
MDRYRVHRISDSNCWSNFTNSRAYRADVTSLVGGNGAYALSNFVKGSYPNPTADINGVSLLLFYDDGNAANNAISWFSSATIRTGRTPSIRRAGP